MRRDETRSIHSLDPPAVENLLDVTPPLMVQSSSRDSDTPSSVCSFASSSRGRCSSIIEDTSLGFRHLEKKFANYAGIDHVKPTCGSPTCGEHVRLLEERLKAALEERDEAWIVIEDIRKTVSDTNSI